MAAALLPLSSQAGPVLDRGASREFQVNIHEVDDQRVPSVVADADGNFLVTWQSQGQAAPGWDVYSRRLRTSGEVSDREIRVNDFTGGRQDGQHVAALDPGGFVIAWNGESAREEPHGIHARRLDGSGRPLASDLIVGGLSEEFQMLPRVGTASDGSFLVAWEGRGIVDDTFSILGQRMSFQGASEGPLMEISQQQDTQQRGVDLARGRDALYMTVWQSSGQDGDGWGVFGRCIGDDGSDTGEFQVNQSTAGGQSRPRVASLGQRGFAVVWHDNSGRSTFEYRRVMLRHFDRQCLPLGDERQVNQFDQRIQDLPTISADDAGNHVVVWQSLPDDFENQGIFARRVDASGDFHGDEIRVSPEREAFQDFPDVEMLPGGGFLAVWEQISQESSGFEIIARRFPAPTSTYLDALSGVEQAAPAGQAFPEPLVVRVRDQWGVPVSGQTVRFSSEGGDAGAVFAAGAAAQTVTTDGDGMAAVTARANDLAGVHLVRAATPDGRLKTSFELENLGTGAVGPRPVPAGAWPAWLVLATCLLGAAWLLGPRRTGVAATATPGTRG